MNLPPKILGYVMFSSFLVACDQEAIAVSDFDRCIERVKEREFDCVAEGRDSYGAGIGGRCGMESYRASLDCERYKD